jgi:U3 small nucleolar ribonucleoprotein component
MLLPFISRAGVCIRVTVYTRDEKRRRRRRRRGRRKEEKKKKKKKEKEERRSRGEDYRRVSTSNEREGSNERE